MIYTLELNETMMLVLCEALALTPVPIRTLRPLFAEIWLQAFVHAAGIPYPEPAAKRRKPRLKHAKETPPPPATGSRAPA